MQVRALTGSDGRGMIPPNGSKLVGLVVDIYVDQQLVSVVVPMLPRDLSCNPATLIEIDARGLFTYAESPMT